MDQDTKAAFCKYRLERARDDLETAQLNLNAGKLRGAVNRAYYAIFHMASAALLWRGEQRARHSGVQSAFGSELINARLIEPEYGKILTQARRERERQDYQFPLPPVAEEKVQQVVADAGRFVARIEHYLREAGALDDDTQQN